MKTVNGIKGPMQKKHLMKLIEELKKFVMILLVCSISFSCSSNETRVYKGKLKDSFLNSEILLDYKYYLESDSIFFVNNKIVEKGCQHRILLGVVDKNIHGLFEVQNNLCYTLNIGSSSFQSTTFLENKNIICEIEVIEPASDTYPDSILPIQQRIIVFDKSFNIISFVQNTTDIDAEIIGFKW